MSKLDLTIARDIVFTAMSDLEAGKTEMDGVVKQRLTGTIATIHQLDEEESQALLDKTYRRARQSVGWFY